MPIHPDWRELYHSFIEQYGEEKGKSVFYAYCEKHSIDYTKPKPKKEGFSWAGSIKEIPGVTNLIRGKALHPLRTVHPEEWPQVREYLEEELEKSAHTLAGKPLLLDHYQVLRGKVLGAEYEDGAIEYVAQLNDSGVMELIRNGAIKHVSVEFEWQSLKNVNGVAPLGINFTGLSLLRLFEPGDPQTTVELFESIVKQLKEAKNVRRGGHQGMSTVKEQAQPAAAPAGIQSVSPTSPTAQGAIKMKEEKRPQTLEGRVTFLETLHRLKEQDAELTEEEIKQKIVDLTKQKEELDSKLYPESSLSEEEKTAIRTQIDVLYAEIQAYEQALAAKIAGQATPPPAATAQEAEWDTEYVNALSDNCFAVIAGGGEKDEQGKTVPRTLRKLPYKNAQGNIDLSHLRNALARLNQIEPASLIPAAKKKLCAAARSEKAEDLVSEFCGEEEPAEESTTEQQGEQEPEKDEHGCIIGKERYDEEQDKCVPIETATEQQGNEEPPKAGEPKTDRQRFMDHYGLTEEQMTSVLEWIGEDVYKLLPEPGTKRQQQGAEKKKGLGEAIIDPGAPSEPSDLISKKEVLALIPERRIWRSWSYGPQRLVQDLKRKLKESEA